MIRYHEGKNGKGKDAKHSWLPITAGLRDWKTQMTKGDQELFAAVAGDLLSELGSEYGFQSRGSIDFVDVVRRQFEEDFTKRI